MTRDEIVELAKGLLREKSLIRKARAVLENDGAFGASRISNWFAKSPPAFPQGFLEGLALGLLHPGAPRDNPAEVLHLHTPLTAISPANPILSGVPTQLTTNRRADLLQTRLWAQKVVHLTVVEKLKNHPQGYQTLCTTLRYWHGVHRLDPEGGFLSYTAYSEGQPEPESIRPIGDLPDARVSVDRVFSKQTGKKSSPPLGQGLFKVQYRAQLPALRPPDTNSISFGFAYQAHDVFRERAEKGSTHEFSSGINLIPALDAFVVVVLPADYVSARPNATWAKEYNPVPGSSPVEYIQEVILPSFSEEEIDEEKYNRDFKPLLDLWMSNGRQVDRVSAGEGRRELPPLLGQHLTDAYKERPVWPEFPEPLPRSKVLTANFATPNPLKHLALFWRLRSR